MNFEIDAWFIALIIALIIGGVHHIHHRLQVHRGTIKTGIKPFVDCPSAEKIPITGGGGYVPSIRYVGKELLTRDLPRLDEGIGSLPKCSHCEKHCSMQHITKDWRDWQYGIGLIPPLQIKDA